VVNTVIIIRKLAATPVQPVQLVDTVVVALHAFIALLENMATKLVNPVVKIVPMGITTQVLETQDVLLDVRLKKGQLPVWAKRVRVIEIEA